MLRVVLPPAHPRSLTTRGRAKAMHSPMTDRYRVDGSGTSTKAGSIKRPASLSRRSPRASTRVPLGRRRVLSANRRRSIRARLLRRSAVQRCGLRRSHRDPARRPARTEVEREFATLEGALTTAFQGATAPRYSTLAARKLRAGLHRSSRRSPGSPSPTARRSSSSQLRDGLMNGVCQGPRI